MKLENSVSETIEAVRSSYNVEVAHCRRLKTTELFGCEAPYSPLLSHKFMTESLDAKWRAWNDAGIELL